MRARSAMRARSLGARRSAQRSRFALAFNQGGERLGGETSGPLFMQCVMRSRTGTSAPSALPVRFQAGKIFLSTNRKSHFLSLIIGSISQECVMIK